MDDGNDVAFWIHPTDPAKSLVLVSAGTAGLEAFTLDGTRSARFTGGEFDYVDVSYGAGVGADAGAMVVAYDRKQRGLWALTIDPETLAIRAASRGAFGTQGEVTGICTYRSAPTGDQYVFAAADGLLEQWKLYAAGGEVRGTRVRTVPIGIGAAYCAADSQTASVYVTEETVGIWKLAAEPETEATRTATDLVAPFGALNEEVKGIAVYRVDASTAYLLATDVGNEGYVVYALADHKPLGRFKIVAASGNPQLDAVGESEGLAATAYDFGGAHPGGLVATFDESNEETDPVRQLSNRELEVFRHLGRGRSTREIADALYLSPKTVETYRANIKSKLGIRTAPELIQRATLWVESLGAEV